MYVCGTRNKLLIYVKPIHTNKQNEETKHNGREPQRKEEFGKRNAYERTYTIADRK